MANVLPAEDVLDVQYNITVNAVAVAVDAIDQNQIPTDEQIVRENRRFVKILNAQERDGANGGLNNGEYCAAIMRHHKVLSIRGDVELGNTNGAIVFQLGQIQNQLNQRFDGITQRFDGITQRLDGITQRLDGIEGRFDVMATKIHADSARAFNSHLDSVTSSTVVYRRVVKHIRGHPVQAGLPPAVPDVHFQAEYAIGDEPPDNLMPLNFVELDGMGNAEDIAPLRRRLRAIYWFYNDHRLALGAHANRATCNNILRALEHFLKYP